VEPERLAAVIRTVRDPGGVQVYVASMLVDFRKGATGLMALVRDGADYEGNESMGSESRPRWSRGWSTALPTKSSIR
jgi:hypothetical protein